MKKRKAKEPRQMKPAKRKGANGSPTALAVPNRRRPEVEGARTGLMDADDQVAAMLRLNAEGLKVGRGLGALIAALGIFVDGIVAGYDEMKSGASDAR